MNSAGPPLPAALETGATAAYDGGQEEELGPVSPELILVSPPAVRSRALAALPPVPDALARPPVPEASTDSGPAALPTDGSDSRLDRLRVLRPVAALIVIGACGFFLGNRWDDDIRPTSAFVDATSVVTSGATSGIASASNGQQQTLTRPEPSAPPPKTTSHVKPHRPHAVPQPLPVRSFAWPPQPGAAGYVLRILRDVHVVYEGRTATAKITLPKQLRLVPGRYRWQVRRMVRASRKASGPAIVDATFTVAAKTESKR